MSSVPAFAEDEQEIPEVRHVQAGFRTYSYRERGDGPPVVLLHGIGANSGSWVNQLDALAGDLRMIAWDAPGYGTTTHLAADSPSAADYAEALGAFVDVLGLDRFLLVGHSLGALVAGAYAARHPTRLTALLLLSPAGGYGNAHPVLRMERLNLRLRMMDELGPNGLAEKRSANVLGPSAPPEARALVKRAMRELDPAGHAQAARMLANGKLTDDLERFDGLGLVACGTEDTVTVADDCRRIATHLRSRLFRPLAGLGHACYAESPQTISNEILWLAREAGMLAA